MFESLFPAGCLVLLMLLSTGCDRIRASLGKPTSTDLAAIRASDRPEALLIRIWTRREAFAKLTGITEGLRSRNFHDREAAREAYGVLFTEGQEESFLYTAAQFI